MRTYVRSQTSLLLRRLATEATRTTGNADEDSIHDLRVAIRRLSRCLRVFSKFYPARSWKPIRRRLADLMDSCGTVRDRDIAIGLLTEAGLRVSAPLVRRLQAERRAAARELELELQEWKARRFTRVWRKRLEL
jgi:CHAD domain-containing protein